MKYPPRSLAAPLLLVLLVALACNLPSSLNGTPQAAATLSDLYTAAALTLNASVSQASSATPVSTGTSPFPTFATRPTLTAAPVVACNAAAFIKDVTIADGTTLDPGEGFTKTWRLQNVGTCSWTAAYALVFVSGDRLKAPGSVSLPGNVNPGQSVDLSAGMTAPEANGIYQGYWKLRSGGGVLFGLGPQAQSAFWVRIKVAGPTYTAYDFVLHYCDASWQNNNKDLPCPGAEGDSKGYVIALDHPVLENGKEQDDAGLSTAPKDTFNGLIFGKYPAVKVHDGDRFQARVSCQFKAYACNVIFTLEYQVDGGVVKSLGSWNEAYEGKYYPVDLNLGSLAGENVKFILRLAANGSANDDRALWIAPRITRKGIQPPTSTPTATFTSSPTPTLTPSPTFTATPTATP